MQLEPLQPIYFDAARKLLERAFPYDQMGVVAEEKLGSENGARAGHAIAALVDGALAGVLATAGRFIKLLAVAEEHRRRGVGSALLRKAGELAPGSRLRLLDHPGNYLSPGLDERSIEARDFFLRRNFVEVGRVENIRAPLTNNPLTTDERADELAARAGALGYAVRRLSDCDGETQDRFFSFVGSEFSPVWSFETRRALKGPAKAVHAAWHGTTPVAFAAADGNNRGLGWFGPAGTVPAHRGRGLGEALLIACLLDVRALPEGGVIAWIGPKEFYRKACGAVDDRRFLQLEEK